MTTFFQFEKMRVPICVNSRFWTVRVIVNYTHLLVPGVLCYFLGEGSHFLWFDYLRQSACQLLKAGCSCVTSLQLRIQTTQINNCRMCHWQFSKFLTTGNISIPQGSMKIIKPVVFYLVLPQTHETFFL